ncbi:MAG: SH3 domain-containing protein [Kouleothrix sp.]|nr:SH3 domain-containing protein [Kouleothrix sp.]
MFGFGGKDDEMKKIGEQMRNLSEQIGKLQQELLAKNTQVTDLQSKLDEALRQGKSVNTNDLDKARDQVRELQDQLTAIKTQQEAAASAVAGKAAEAGTSVAESGSRGAETERVATLGGLAVGATAYVTRAGGLPLRLRSGPSLNDSILDRLQPGTQMTLQEGPHSADGHNWWKIQTTDGRQGWVAGEDLRTQAD